MGSAAEEASRKTEVVEAQRVHETSHRRAADLASVVEAQEGCVVSSRRAVDRVEVVEAQKVHETSCGGAADVVGVVEAQEGCVLSPRRAADPVRVVEAREMCETRGRAVDSRGVVEARGKDELSRRRAADSRKRGVSVRKGKTGKWRMELEARVGKLELSARDFSDELQGMRGSLEVAQGEVEGLRVEVQDAFKGARGMLRDSLEQLKSFVEEVLGRVKAEMGAMRQEMETVRAESARLKAALTSDAVAKGDPWKATVSSRTVAGESTHERCSRMSKSQGKGDKGKGKVRKGKEARKVSCFICEGSHYARECSQRKSRNALVAGDAKEASSGKSTLRCYLCEGAHRVKDCREKKTLSAMQIAREEEASNGGKEHQGAMRFLNSVSVVKEEPVRSAKVTKPKENWTRPMDGPKSETVVANGLATKSRVPKEVPVRSAKVTKQREKRARPTDGLKFVEKVANGLATNTARVEHASNDGEKYLGAMQLSKSVNVTKEVPVRSAKVTKPKENWTRPMDGPKFVDEVANGLAAKVLLATGASVTFTASEDGPSKPSVELALEGDPSKSNMEMALSGGSGKARREVASSRGSSKASDMEESLT